MANKIWGKGFWLQVIENGLTFDANNLYKLQDDDIFYENRDKNEVFHDLSKDEITELFVMSTALSVVPYVQEIFKIFDYNVVNSSKRDEGMPDFILDENYAFEITAAGLDIFRFKDGVEYENSIIERNSNPVISNKINKSSVDGGSIMIERAKNISNAIAKKIEKDYAYDTSLIIWPTRTLNYALVWPALIFQELIKEYYKTMEEALLKFDSIIIIEKALINQDFSVTNDSETDIDKHDINIGRYDHSVCFFINLETLHILKNLEGKEFFHEINKYIYEYWSKENTQ